MRTDIQALRGIAVLLVMMYHAEFSFFSKGYLGVDIFFVLSGFLITRIILSDLAKGEFSFKAFFLRRAKRLLPSAYVVFFVTSILSAFFLSIPQLWHLLAQLIASLTVTANMLFWQDTNYFAGASDLMPLLHVWSLSLEEQFYLVLPLVLFLTAKKYRAWVIVVAAILSFILCLMWVSSNTSAAFFLLPARAWELLLGSILASSLLPDANDKKYKEIVVFLCVAVIAFVVTVGIDNVHPRFDALLVCLSTFLIVWFRTGLLNSGIHSQVLSKIGDISYSLYLVHWPLIAITKNIWIDGVVPDYLYGILFLVSFPLAYILYHGVENRFRYGIFTKRNNPFAFIVAGSLVVILPVIISLYVAKNISDKDWARIRVQNYGFSAECEYQADFFWKRQCSNSDKPAVLVWGDSYAMHLIPGILKDSGKWQVAQATRSSCWPNLYMAQVNDSYNKQWARSCLEFNQSVIEYIKSNSIKYVILASRMNQLEGDVLYRDDIVTAKIEDVVDSYKSTLEMLKESGATPIFVAPPPVNGANIGECLERQSTHKLYVSTMLEDDCSLSRISSIKHQKKAISVLKALESQKSVRVVWPSDILCDAQYCQVMIDDVPLFRDEGHYSIRGSELLVPKLNILGL